MRVAIDLNHQHLRPTTGEVHDVAPDHLLPEFGSIKASP
jgi:hypothetical protein